MDVFAHALWTNAVFYKKFRTEKVQRWIAVLFGVLPDLLVFTPATIYLIFHRSAMSRIGVFSSHAWPFVYAQMGYNFTHSLVIFVAAMLIVTAIRRGRQYWPMWGWALHIAIDIPSHRGFFETPFLFPLSGYKFDHGIPWSHPVFMLINYSLLAAVYLLWFFVFRKKYAKS